MSKIIIKERLAMITVFNRKTLIIDSSAVELARTTAKLKEHGIPYEVRTRKSQSTQSMMIHAKMAAGMGGSGVSFKDVNGEVFFTYFVYVRKKDLAKAQAAIN